MGGFVMSNVVGDSDIEDNTGEICCKVRLKTVPHVEKIVQSDNANILAGRQMNLFLPHVYSASGLMLVAYWTFR